jgi:hypothetical protein
MIKEIINWFSEKHETNKMSEQQIMDLLAQDLPQD